MKNYTQRMIRRLGVSLLVFVVASFGYADFLQRQRLEAEEIQRFVDEVNAREERLDEELQPSIDRNKGLDQQGRHRN